MDEELRVFDFSIKVDHIFVLILLVTAVLRFGDMANHNLWIDESRDSLDAAFLAKHPFDLTGIPFAMHPPFFTYVISVFFLILGVNDFSARLAPALLGTLIPIVMYLMGSKIFGKKPALLATILFSTSYLPVFLSTRILTDVAIAFTFTLTIICFYLGFELGKKLDVFGRKVSYTIISGLFLGFALLTKELAYLIPLVLFVYLLLTRGLDFSWLKNREIWIALLLAAVVFSPWAYRNTVVSGDPIELSKWVGQNTAQDFTRISDFFYYFKSFPSFFGLAETLLLAVGLLLILTKPDRKGLLLLSWIGVMMLFLSWYGQKEPRFLLLIFPHSIWR